MAGKQRHFGLDDGRGECIPRAPNEIVVWNQFLLDVLVRQNFVRQLTFVRSANNFCFVVVLIRCCLLLFAGHFGKPRVLVYDKYSNDKYINMFLCSKFDIIISYITSYEINYYY